MLNCNKLFELFRKNEIIFFTGVPDSTFKDWMLFLEENNGKLLTNRISSIEREAIGIAAGYYCATKKLAVVYMQNSGLGNTVNPLTSLADKEIYGIPMMLMIGWRGEPGKKDEPQHKKMGRITISLLDVLEIPYKILPEDNNEAEKTICEIKNLAEKLQSPVALIIREGLFEEYISSKETKLDYEMKREDAIKIIADKLNNSELIVTTTGKASRELYEYREEKKVGHQNDFLMVGSMGLASSFAAEIALQKPNKKIFIFDGDGAAIMSMDSFATIGHYSPQNLYHIIFDNFSYDSTGGQPTISKTIDFEKIALACGYKGSKIINTKKELEEEIIKIKFLKGPQLLVIRVNKGARENLGRPKTTPIENKTIFINSLEDKYERN